jgi:hypothetical protein
MTPCGDAQPATSNANVIADTHFQREPISMPISTPHQPELIINIATPAQHMLALIVSACIELSQRAQPPKTWLLLRA